MKDLHTIRSRPRLFLPGFFLSGFFLLGAVVITLLLPASALSLDLDKVPTSPDQTKPLQVGARVPEVSVLAVNGKAIALKDIVGEKPTVLIFYRGGW